MSTPAFRRFAEAIGRRSAAADAVSVAGAAATLCRDVERVLTPIVGTRGVAALLHRSLFLTAKEHPFLALPAPLTAPDEIAGHLRAALLTVPAEPGLTGAAALFDAFDTLLASMIGPALTARLLGPVWDLPSSGDAAQDVRS